MSHHTLQGHTLAVTVLAVTPDGKKSITDSTELMKVVPKDAWTFWDQTMVLHERYICNAKSPQCDRCIFKDMCNSNNPTEPNLESNLLPPSWENALQAEINKPYFPELLEFVQQERQNKQIYPPEQEVFTAFKLTPLEEVKVVILGQDPYHGKGQAHGLSFSVKQGVSLPPSLKNIFQELKTDLGIPIPQQGNLSPWANQGVLMLNAVLTVQASKPNSHKDKGWENFTDAVIKVVSEQRPHVVFVLWGRYAQNKAKLINQPKHTIIKSPHPSPFSANKGFFSSRPFSQVNNALSQANQQPINWSLS